VKANCLIFAIAGLLLAGTASANTVTAQFTGTYGQGVSVYYTRDIGSPVSESTTAGVYKWTQWPGPGQNNSDIPKSFGTFCIDVEGTIGIGGIYTWNVYEGKAAILANPGSRRPPGGPINGTQYDRLLKLYTQYFKPDTWITQEAAAFGASVWEIVWESPLSGLPATYDVDANLLRVTGNSGVQTRAQQMLDFVTSGATVTPNGELYALVNVTNGQDQMVAFGFGGNPVPEPLTLLAFGSAVAGLAGYIRKRRLALA
jgi:hypothetical protein